MMGETSTLSTNLLGTVLLGRYRIVRELAKGGMGVVYLARAEGAVGFVKPVVVKLVLPEHASDRRFVSMFAREAQILSNLRHASIVDVVEFGEQDGAYIMVLEYVRGYHVGQWATYLRLKGRNVPAVIALQVAIDVLDALDHAHRMAHPDGSSMHIVHRDISPSNILLDEDGRARLLDFGVARMRGGDQEYQTQVKGFVGKLIYSAPEIFADGDATPSSDLYSCAVVLHETLLGRNTFRADNQAKTLHRVLNHAPEALEGAVSDAPPGLDAVLNKALAKAPEDRFANARELAAALRALQPQPENDVRAALAGLLKHDFGREMADLLGLESLAERDDAWRRASQRPTSSAPPPARANPDPTYRYDPTFNSGSGLLDTTTHGPMTVGPTSVEMRRGPPTGRPPAHLPVRAVANQSGLTSVAHGATSIKPRRTLTPLLWGLGVIAAAGLGILVSPLFEPTATPRIRVVSSPTPIAASISEHRKQDQPSTATPAPAMKTTPLAEPAARNARPAAESGVLSLTRAVRKQQERFGACFQQHAEALRDIPAMRLEFELEPNGNIHALRVIPASVASTELGRCLHTAASSTRFPQQSKPITFSVPLSASLGMSKKP